MSRQTDLLALVAEDVMTPRPITIAGHVLVAEALREMEARKITAIVVVDDRLIVEGVVHLHDLWRT
jgi:arabinose-5-phosphate isomerase